MERRFCVKKVSEQILQVATAELYRSEYSLIVLSESSALLQRLREHLVFPDVSICYRLPGEAHCLCEVRSGNFRYWVFHFLIHLGVFLSSLLLSYVLLDCFSDCKFAGSLTDLCQIS